MTHEIGGRKRQMLYYISIQIFPTCFFSHLYNEYSIDKIIYKRPFKSTIDFFCEKKTNERLFSINTRLYLDWINLIQIINIFFHFLKYSFSNNNQILNILSLSTKKRHYRYNNINQRWNNRTWTITKINISIRIISTYLLTISYLFHLFRHIYIHKQHRYKHNTN